MSKQHLFSQIYGYTVCLIALIFSIVSIPAFVVSVMDQSDSAISSRLSLKYTSFESFKYKQLASQKKAEAVEKEITEKVQTPDDQALRVMYDSEKTSEMDRLTYQAKRYFIKRLLMMIISLLGFIMHWIWVRNITETKSEKETPSHCLT